MRKILLACVVLAACKSKGNAPHHEPVKGPAMWKVDVVDLSIQTLDDHDQPKGEVQSISERDRAVMRCRLEADPGNDAVSTWITASVDETGHTRMTHDRDPSVPKDVNGCAHQAVANVKLTSTPGEYKVMMKVTFSEPAVQ